MLDLERLDDRELLALSCRSPQAFGVFYARHERRLLRFLLKRCRDAELAADLCAETFAEALHSRRRGASIAEVPVAWLLGIASHKWIDSARRGEVEIRARERLQMRAVELTRGQLSDIERLLDEDDVAALLAGLTPEQRVAVRAYVVRGEPYAQIATQLRCSELVVRKRVSRGLSVLRTRLGAVR